MEKGFGRNATDIQTCATMRGTFFNHGYFQSKLCCTNSANISAGAGADDGDVIGHDGFHFFAGGCFGSLGMAA